MTDSANCICIHGYASTCPLHGDPNSIRAVSDAPMTPSEFAEKIWRASITADDDAANWQFWLEKLITDRDAAIRQQAQAEGRNDMLRWIQASLMGYPNAGGDIVVMKEVERIAAQARLDEAKLWHMHNGKLMRHGSECPQCARILSLEAELARLAAADAEKPAEGAK